MTIISPSLYWKEQSKRRTSPTIKRKKSQYSNILFCTNILFNLSLLFNRKRFLFGNDTYKWNLFSTVVILTGSLTEIWFRVRSFITYIYFNVSTSRSRGFSRFYPEKNIFLWIQDVHSFYFNNLCPKINFVYWANYIFIIMKSPPWLTQNADLKDQDKVCISSIHTDAITKLWKLENSIHIVSI